MRPYIATLWAASILVFTGCASDGYLHDRLRDAKDMGTFSLGAGVGARAQLGPVNISPAIAQADFVGLRGGEWFLLTDFGEEDEVIPTDVGFAYWGSSVFVLNDCPRLRERAKAYAAYPWGAAEEAQFSRANTDTIPFITLPRMHTGLEAGNLEFDRHPAAYYSQVELCLALLGSVRLGFNPGEILDFVVGWSTFDIYRDDLPRPIPTPE